jgi:hypothetical protein
MRCGLDSGSGHNLQPGLSPADALDSLAGADPDMEPVHLKAQYIQQETR